MKVESKSIRVSPCPLCGEESFLHTNNEFNRRDLFWVKCSNLQCGCTANATDDQNLTLRNWNRRAGLAA